MAALAGLLAGALVLLVGASPVGTGLDRFVWGVAAAAAVGGAMAGGEPSGWAPLDLVLRAGLAAAVVLAAPVGRSVVPLVWAVALATAAAWVGGGPLTLAAPIALGLLAAGLATRVPAPALEAVAGALATQALLRIDGPLINGASAALAALAVVPLLVAGAMTLEGRSRLVVRRAAIGVAAYCVLGGGLAVLAAFFASDHVDDGIAAAEAGRAAVGTDELDLAAAQFAASSLAFDDAAGILGSWWARPAFAVPFVAQQTRAVATMADRGGALADDASVALEVIDPESLTPVDGRIDLAAVAAVADPLARVARSLDRSYDLLEGVESPWLLGPVDRRLRQLTGEVERARPGATRAAEAARLAPAFLGGDGPRRYLVVVQTPSEARGSGGFMGNFGELVADGGHLELSRFGRLDELNAGRVDPAAIQLDGVEELEARYGAGVIRTWGVNNFSPDFAAVAGVMAQLYPQSGGAPVDGVLSIDPYGLAAILRAIGPISVEGWPEPLTADNVATVLLHEQYLRFDTAENAERVDFLGTAAEAVFGRLVDGGFAGPRALADALAPAVAARRLQLVGTHPEEQALFESLGATGAAPPVAGDSIGFVGQNYAGNKIDYFLTRHAAYDVRWDPATGAVDATLELRITNGAPSAGLPETVISGGGFEETNQTETADGENLMLLSLYSALPLDSLALDGVPLGASGAVEAGRLVYSAFVSVPSGATRTVTAVVRGQIPVGEPYRLDPIWQPVVTPDVLDVRVQVPEGWVFDDVTGLALESDRSATAGWTLDQERAATAGAHRAGSPLLDWLRGGP